ncbi:hypothetical protein Bca52824_048096 [Brassica carinata]|uniref:Uncharacterized protein n=1 Tax=Brassica carinata TaxID=52824 RepID=A0A8X7RIH0_BRACI|nr:hypothetical protein Bca52824_048096 [Brassica carinata]
MENRFAAEDFTDDQKMALAYAVIRGEAESWYNNRVSRPNCFLLGVGKKVARNRDDEAITIVRGN